MEEIPTTARPINCKAAVLWTPGEKHKFETIVVAAPKRNQVRIKILYTSICHTDVTLAKMERLASMFPVIVGHESVGVVESVGEGVTNVKAGDQVMPFMQGQCEACFDCQGDRTNVCPERPVEMISPTLCEASEPHLSTEDGRVINCAFGISSFSEYVVVHKDNVAKMRPEAPLEKLCVLSCGVGTGIGAVWKVAQVTPGSTVAVFGLGTVGLAVVQACKLAGASRIIGIDTNPSKFQKGKELGLTDTINPKDHDERLSKVIKDLTGGGVRFSFECVGLAKLMTEAVECTASAVGVSVILGVPALPTEEFQVNVVGFLVGKVARGAMQGGLRVKDLPELGDRCIRKELQLDPYITHSLPFSKINEAMEIFESGDCLRCVLQMGK